MKRIFFGFLMVMLLCSHDMYLKLDQYFPAPNTDVVIQLYNGTFDLSENVITRDRMQDVSMVGNGARISVDTSAWFEEGNTTYLNITTGASGTWVTGVSTKARSLGMSAEDFNSYLEHDGVLDMLASRERDGTLIDSAVERYSKHVKTIFQVGETLTDDYKSELGYPIEFIPLKNPYDIHPGHSLPIKLVFNQAPLANQLVYVGSQPTSTNHTHDGHTHSHADGADHQHNDLKQFRTDENGLINVPISHEGVWYIRTIHLVNVEEEGLTHESNWATLTFAVGGGHSHEHEHEEGLPVYVYGILSLLLIGVLFIWFNKKK